MGYWDVVLTWFLGNYGTGLLTIRKVSCPDKHLEVVISTTVFQYDEVDGSLPGRNARTDEYL